MKWLMAGLGLMAVVLIWVVLTYNRLIRLRLLVREAWSGIDVQLKRRHNLVGNLVETVRGYLVHERELLTEVTHLRSKGEAASGVADLSSTENLLSGALRRLFAVMEAYPDLKANTTVLQLQQELSTLEDAIQLARRYYNGSVRNLNIAVESFPSSLIARGFSFQVEPFFTLADPGIREVPGVDFSPSTGPASDSQGGTPS